MLHSFPVPTQKNHSQPLPLSTSCPENPLCYGGKMPIDTTIKFTVKGPFLVLHILRVRTNLLTCINHYNVMQNNVLALKILCALPFHLYFNTIKKPYFKMLTAFNLLKYQKKKTLKICYRFLIIRLNSDHRCTFFK